MGGSSGQQTQQTQQQQQTQQTTPYAPAAPVINSILANLNQSPGYSDAIAAQQQLATLGRQGNQFAGQIGNVASGLLGGGPDRSAPVNAAYSSYLNQTNPFVNMANLDPRNTPGFSDAYNQLQNDIITQNNQAAAASGRTGGGLDTITRNRNLAQSLGGLIQSQYNQNVGNYLNTAQGQLGAGQQQTQILSNLDQVRAAFQQAGLSAADAASQAQIYGPQLLAASAQIPLNYLQQQAGIAGPLAQSFGTTTGSSTGTSSGSQQGQMSGAQQFQLIASGLGHYLVTPVERLRQGGAGNGHS